MLAQAPTDSVLQLIRPVTFAERKAVQIGDALQRVSNLRGALTLEFLRERSVDDARAWLEDLPGVGPKVSAAVVNFSTLHMPALVVDSHYLRIARRLEFIAARTCDNEASRSLSRLVPKEMTADDLQQHYFVMKQHGRAVCRYHSTSCHVCPLSTMCPMAGRRMRTATRGPASPTVPHDASI